MRALLQGLAEAHALARAEGACTGWDTVFVIGAGTGTDWPALQALGAARTVLVEPQQRLADELSRTVRGAPGVEVWPVALVPHEAPEVTLYMLVQARESSTAAPTGLLRHYPRLAGLPHAQAVAARPVTAALQALALPEDGRHLLVLDAPGQGMSLLRALPDAALQAFERVLVRGGTEPLYEGDEPLALAAERLQHAGFGVEAEDDEALPPHAAFLLRRDDARVAQLRLTARCEAAEQRHRALEEALQAAHQELERTQAEQGAVINGLASENDKLLAERYTLATERERLVEEKADLVFSLDAVCDENNRLLEERNSLAAQRDALAKDWDHLVVQRDGLANEKADLITTRDALAHDKSQLLEERNSLAAQRDALSQEKANLIAARDAFAHDKNQLLDERNSLVAQRDGLANEKADLMGARDAIAHEKSQLLDERNGLAAQRDALSQEKADLIAARDALAHDKNQLLDERNSLAAQRESLAQEKADLITTRDALATEKASLGTQLEEALQQLQSARAENQELGMRQHLMQEELVKAEAQIELIKDLLLREPGL